MSSDNLKEKTAQGILWGAIGNGAQQLVMLVIGVVLARKLAVTDYGMVGVLTVFSLLAGNLQESGFTSALGIKKETTDKDFNAVFWFSCLVSAFMYLLLFCAAPFIAHFLHTPELTLYGRVIFLGFFISSFGTAHAAWLFRNLMVRQKTTSQVTASITSGVIGLSAAFIGWGCWSLIVMDITYKLVYTLMIWQFSQWRPQLPMTKEERRSLFSPIWEMLPFSVKILATNMLMTLNGQLVQFLLGRFYPMTSVGYYSQAQKWNTLGQQQLLGMVNSVSQPVMAKVNDDGERQQRVVLTMLRFMAFFSFPVMLGLALVAPIIPVIIGEKWQSCVPLLQMLCIAGSTVPLSQTLSHLVISRGRSDMFLITTTCSMLVQLALLVFMHSYGLEKVVLCISMVQILMFLVWWRVAALLMPIPVWSLVKAVAPSLIAAIVTMCVAYVLCKNPWIQIPIAIVVYVILVSPTSTFKECLQFIRKRR